MARLQTLLLPNGDFAFILDEFDGKALPWANFAETCGARDILITDDTIRILEPFAESPTEPDPDSDKPWDVRCADLDDAPEIIQRFIGAAFGTGPFADLRQPCGDDCDCAATTPTGDEPATDNPQSATDHPTAEEISARVAEKVRGEGGLSMAAEQTFAEKRVFEIMSVGLRGHGTIQALNADGDPIVNPFPFGSYVPAPEHVAEAEMEEAAEAEPRRWRDQAGHLWIYLSTSTVQLCDEAGKPIRAELRAREYVEQQYGPLTIVEAEPFAATAWPVDHAIAETFKQSQLVVPHIAAPTTPELTADPTADAVRAQVLGTDPLFGDVTVPLTKGVGGPQIGTATVTPDGKMTGTLGEAVDATTLQRLMDDAPYSADWAAAKAGRQCGAMNSAGRPCALRHDHPYLHEFEPDVRA